MSQEEQIVEECRKGNRNAQKILYEMYAGWLLGVCLRYVGQRDVAEDLLQDGFVQILTHIHQFQWQGEGSLKSWMLRVQRNVILQHLRNKAKLNSILSIDDTHEQLEDIITEPEDIGGIPSRVLMEMIGELPLGYRTVFNLYVIDGLSHRKIAEMLGIKERSSASQLLHARRLLAAKINIWNKKNL